MVTLLHYPRDNLAMNLTKGSTGALMLVAVAAGCSRPPVPTTLSGVPLVGPLIPARTTMVTAWDVPQNPLADKTLDDSHLSKDIRWGFKLFTNTPAEAKPF